MRRPGAARPNADRSAFAGFRFPPEVITVAVRWYLRYGLSYRDVEELLAERGIEVDHVTCIGGCSGSPVVRRGRSAVPARRRRPLVRGSHRRRGAGRIPPVRLSRSRTVDGFRRICRASTFAACPDRHRRQTSPTSAGDNAVRTISHHPIHRRSDDHEVLR
jgi:hypothetical protein